MLECAGLPEFAEDLSALQTTGAINKPIILGSRTLPDGEESDAFVIPDTLEAPAYPLHLRS